MIHQENITEKLVDLVFDIKDKKFDIEVVNQFKRALMDYVSASITGSNMPVSLNLLGYLNDIDNSDKCSVIGHDSFLSPLNAALMNGTSAHSLDFDDGHTHGSIHIGGVVFPAVFAVAEYHNNTPEEIIKAVVIGYEVAGKLAGALHPNIWKRGFHNTPVIGIFGATVAVALLLKGSKEQMKDALGHAGSFAGGLFEFLGEGADTKRVHPGKAARDAILSAELASRRISGPKKVFEGKNGFVRAFSDGKINLKRLFTSNFHNNFEINNIYFKPYPCCRHLHGPIEISLKLKEKYKIDVQKIQSIKIGTYLVGSKHNHKHVTHLLDAQMSIPCAVALALVFGEVTIDTFSESKLQSPQVKRLIDKIEVTVDDTCEELYPKHRSSVVNIVMEDGDGYREFLEDPKGESSNPLSDEELGNKLRDNVHKDVNREMIEKIIKTVWDFDELKDIRELTSLLNLSSP